VIWLVDGWMDGGNDGHGDMAADEGCLCRGHASLLAGPGDLTIHWISTDASPARRKRACLGYAMLDPAAIFP